MTTHLTKIWWDSSESKLVEQVILEAEIYKREWVGLTDEDVFSCYSGQPQDDADMHTFARAIEAKLKERNT